MPRWVKRGAMFAACWVAAMIGLAVVGAFLLPAGPNLDQRVDAFAGLAGNLAGAGAILIPLFFYLRERKARPSTAVGTTRQ